MDQKDRIKDYYEPRLRKEVHDHAILGWEDAQSHEKRFHVLYSEIDLSGKSVLDIGCGLGSLYRYLLDRSVNCSYTGTDILDSMILEAAKRYPGVKFISGDVFHEDIISCKSFDVIYSSGIFNLKMSDNTGILIDSFVKMLTWARNSVVFNLLSGDSPDRDDEHYMYYSSGDVIQKLGPHLPEGAEIRVIDGYLPNDFTVVCRLAGV